MLFWHGNEAMLYPCMIGCLLYKASLAFPSKQRIDVVLGLECKPSQSRIGYLHAWLPMVK